MQGIQVPFRELGVRDGSSPAVCADLETSSVRRQLLVEWPNVRAATAQLVGYSFLDANNALTRWLPQEDWQFPGLFANKVTNAHGLGWRDKVAQVWGSVNAYALACLDVDFEPRNYDVLSEGDITDEDEVRNEFLRFVEVLTTPEGEYLSIPNNTGTFKFSEGTASPTGILSVVPGNIGKIVSTANYVFRWHQVPDAGLPENDIQKAIGCTNKTDFGDPDTSRLFFPAGTALLIGSGWRRTWMFTDTRVRPSWCIEYMFKYNRRGHNKLFNFKDPTPDWYQASIGGNYFEPGSVPDGQLTYDEYDMNKLFKTN